MRRSYQADGCRNITHSAVESFHPTSRPGESAGGQEMGSRWGNRILGQTTAAACAVLVDCLLSYLLDAFGISSPRYMHFIEEKRGTGLA